MTDLGWPKGGLVPDPTEDALNQLGAEADRQARFAAAWQVSNTDPVAFLESLVSPGDLDGHAVRWLAAHADCHRLIMAGFARVVDFGDTLSVRVISAVDDSGSWVGVSAGQGQVTMLVRGDPSVEV